MVARTDSKDGGEAMAAPPPPVSLSEARRTPHAYPKLHIVAPAFDSKAAESCLRFRLHCIKGRQTPSPPGRITLVRVDRLLWPA